MFQPFDVSMILKHKDDEISMKYQDKYNLMNKIIKLVSEYKKFGIYARAPIMSEVIDENSVDFFYLPLAEMIGITENFDFSLIIYDMLEKIKEEIQDQSFVIREKVEFNT